MLKAKIRIQDLAIAAKDCNQIISFGESYICPYKHPALDWKLIKSEGRWFLWVFEKLGRAENFFSEREVVNFDDYKMYYKDTVSWKADFTIIEVLEVEHRLKVRSGRLGIAPLYYSFKNDCLIISWDIADFALRSNVLNGDCVIRYLAMETYYSSSQILSGVYMLTERSYLEMTPNGVRYNYPQPAVYPNTVTNISNQEALEQFDNILKEAVIGRSTKYHEICCELSGGVDSTSVILSLKSLKFNISALSIYLDEKTNAAQHDRLSKILSSLNLRNVGVNMENYIPSFDLCSSGAAHYLNLDEFYNEAFFELWRAAAKCGCSYIYRGFGGDELCPVFSHDAIQDRFPNAAVNSVKNSDYAGIIPKKYAELIGGLGSFDAPESIVPETALLAIAASASPSLKMGLWPIYPLADPQIVSFFYSLPYKMRNNKSLLREFACKLAGFEIFTDNYLKEDFSDVLPKAIIMQRNLIESQLQTCALADHGFVNLSKIRSLVAQVCETKCSRAAGLLANFLLLERFVRQIQ